MSALGWAGLVTDIIGNERKIDRDADAADEAWRRGQENMGISNAFSAAEAEKARAFNERMSATAHQREVADLQAAGLNPLLSLNRGAAASGPSASASSGAPVPQRAAAPDGRGLGSVAYQVDNIRADTSKKVQEGYWLSRDTEKKYQEQQLVEEQQKTQRHLTKQAEHQAGILSNTAKGAELEGDIDETKYGALMRYIDRAVRSITGGGSAWRNFTK